MPLVTNTGGTSPPDLAAIACNGSRQLDADSRKASRRLPGCSTVPAKIDSRIRKRHSCRSNPEMIQTMMSTGAGRVNSKYRDANTLWLVKRATKKKIIGDNVAHVASSSTNSG